MRGVGPPSLVGPRIGKKRLLVQGKLGPVDRTATVARLKNTQAARFGMRIYGLGRALDAKGSILGVVGDMGPIETLREQEAQQASLPRARGQAFLRVKQNARTEIADLRQQGSLKLVFPRQRASALPMILVNTAGGVTGGDAFRFEAEIGRDASLNLTTQASERIYRSVSGQAGEIQAQIHVAPGGRLTWLPQETIVFDGAALKRRLVVDLAPAAECLLLESVVFGRAAMRETIQRIVWRDEIIVNRDGAPVFWDRQTINEANFNGPAAVVSRGNHRAMAVFVLASESAGDRLEKIRDLAQSLANAAIEIGVSALSEDLLTIRILASDGYTLRKAMLPLTHGLTGEDLPKVWML